MDMKRLSGKTAVVIGSTSGIGAAIAKLYAKEGAQTVVVGPQMDLEKGHKVVEEIKSEGGTASFVCADVTDESSIVSLFKEVVSMYGVIDIMNFNSGLQSVVKPFHEQTLEDWDLIVNVNAKGCFLSMKHIMPIMIEQNHGVIINTASLAATKCTFPYTLSMYSMSKAQVMSLTRSAAWEYGKYNIRVNSISPGYVSTEALPFSRLEPEIVGKILSNIPLGRPATVDDVARVSLFLASDDSGYMTGQDFAVDGGQIVT